MSNNNRYVDSNLAPASVDHGGDLTDLELDDEYDMEESNNNNNMDDDDDDDDDDDKLGDGIDFNGLISPDEMRRAITEKDYVQAFHTLDGGFMIRKVDELTGDFKKEAELHSTDKLDPQIKLQMYYRKAFEYRMANAFEAEDMNNKANLLTFITLILSSTTSILLLAGSSPNVIQAGAVLAALITFCTGLSSYMGYSRRYEAHCISVSDFSRIQRELANLIQTESNETIAREFESIATKFNEARTRMPLLYPDYIEAYRDENGKRIFKRIIDAALQKESIDNVNGMSELGYFTTDASEMDIIRELNEEISNQSSRQINKIILKNI
jgi:hypothetical protein